MNHSQEYQSSLLELYKILKEIALMEDMFGQNPLKILMKYFKIYFTICRNTTNKQMQSNISDERKERQHISKYLCE